MYMYNYDLDSGFYECRVEIACDTGKMEGVITLVEQNTHSTNFMLSFGGCYCMFAQGLLASMIRIAKDSLYNCLNCCSFCRYSV